MQLNTQKFKPIIECALTKKVDWLFYLFHCFQAVLILYTHFIKRLIVHIPDKHFKMVRYHGIYTKHHKQEIISKKLPICEVFYKTKKQP